MQPAYDACEQLVSPMPLVGMQSKLKVEKMFVPGISVPEFTDWHRGRVGRLAQTAIGSALRDGLLEDRMIKHRIDIHEVRSVGYLEAFAIRVKPVRRQRAG